MRKYSPAHKYDNVTILRSLEVSYWNHVMSTVASIAPAQLPAPEIPTKQQSYQKSLYPRHGIIFTLLETALVLDCSI